VKDLIVDTLKKQLIKLAIGGLIVGVALGFRIYQVSGDGEAQDDAAYREVVERELAESDEAAADGRDAQGGESIWSFSQGSEDDETLASNRAIPCYLDGVTQFMSQDDCVTRGGMPQP
jgi:hypothetical protein